MKTYNITYYTASMGGARVTVEVTVSKAEFSDALKMRAFAVGHAMTYLGCDIGWELVSIATVEHFNKEQ